MKIKIGDIGHISIGQWYGDDILEATKWVQISHIDNDGTIWACDKDGDETEIQENDFTKEGTK